MSDGEKGPLTTGLPPADSGPQAAMIAVEPDKPDGTSDLKGDAKGDGKADNGRALPDQGPSFQEAGATVARLTPISDFLGTRVEPELWTALVGACRDVFGTLRIDQPFGIVAAEEPLLALATAAAISDGELLVPVLQTAKARQAPPLETVVDQYASLIYLREQLPVSLVVQTVAMLGWFADLKQLSQDTRDGVSGDSYRIICVVRALATDVDDPQVLVRLPPFVRDILAHAIVRLRLPTDDPCGDIDTAGELIDRLLREYSLGEIVGALGTPEYSGFNSLAANGDEPALFRTLLEDILGKAEENPRETSSLFVASHFEGLAPAQFVELVDLLAANTPTWQDPAHRRRPSLQVTDEVLRRCHVRFAIARNRKTLFSIFDAAERDLPVHLRRWFASWGALVKERYMNVLAQQMTLGHPLESIARRFADLEADQIDATADAVMGYQRLQRVVFGYPAVGKADPGVWERDRHRLSSCFERAVLRTPSLIRKCLGGRGVPGGDHARAPGPFTQGEAVQALAMTEPADDQAPWPSNLRRGAALIFWSLYGPNENSAAFDDFSPWFIAQPEAGLRRRVAALLLDAILQADRGDAIVEDENFQHYQQPSTLARLLVDIGTHFNEMYKHDQIVPVTLLARGGAHYLMRNLKSKSWQAVRDWRDMGGGDAQITRLGQALLSGSVRDWLNGPEFGSVEDDGTDIPQADDGRDIWRALYATLDGLTGCAKLGVVEDLVIDHWFAEAGDWSVSFHAQLFWNIERSAVGRARYPNVEGPLRPLAAMFPVIVLMAATVAPIDDRANTAQSGPARPRFVFGEEMRTWLRSPTDIAGDTPARGVLERIKHGLAMQKQWQDAQARLGTRLENPEIVRRAFADRADALRAFQEAIRTTAMGDEHPAQRRS